MLQPAVPTTVVDSDVFEQEEFPNATIRLFFEIKKLTLLE